jgi:hypothetical protein
VLSELWVASRNYDARRYRSFGQFADAAAQRRVVDCVRTDPGRARWTFGNGHIHERERPEISRSTTGMNPERWTGSS